MSWQTVVLIGIGAVVAVCCAMLALMAWWGRQHARRLDRMREEVDRRAAERRRGVRPAVSPFALHRSHPR